MDSKRREFYTSEIVIAPTVYVAPLSINPSTGSNSQLRIINIKVKLVFVVKAEPGWSRQNMDRAVLWINACLYYLSSKREQG